ncbi:MAG: hypothetical protein Q8880_00015 [Bacteroidota bacterium]|nr:hypothetical protein [Bacteroidota bacterium]
MHPLLNGVNTYEYSEFYDVNDSAKLSLSLTASLDPQLILPQTVSILNIIGFQFFLSENDNMIPVLTNSAVKMAQVF